MPFSVIFSNKFTIGPVRGYQTLIGNLFPVGCTNDLIF